MLYRKPSNAASQAVNLSPDLLTKYERSQNLAQIFTGHDCLVPDLELVNSLKIHHSIGRRVNHANCRFLMIITFRFSVFLNTVVFVYKIVVLCLSTRSFSDTSNVCFTHAKYCTSSFAHAITVIKPNDLINARMGSEDDSLASHESVNAISMPCEDW